MNTLISFFHRFTGPGLAVLLLTVAAGCALFTENVRFDDLIRPQVGFVRYAEGTALRISGKVARTGYVVEKVRQIKEGRTLLVEVEISPFSRDDVSDSFETDVFLDEFDFVQFGPDRRLIWRRRAGDAELPSRPRPVFVPEPTS